MQGTDGTACDVLFTVLHFMGWVVCKGIWWVGPIPNCFMSQGALPTAALAPVTSCTGILLMFTIPNCVQRWPVDCSRNEWAAGHVEIVNITRIGLHCEL